MPDRQLLAPAFPDDTGAADAALAAALTAYAADPTTLPAALSLLQASRLLVPVVAVAGESSSTSGAWPTTRPVTWRPSWSRRPTGAGGFSPSPRPRRWRAGTLRRARCRCPRRRLPLAARSDGADAAAGRPGPGPCGSSWTADHLRPFAAGWRLAQAGGDVAWID